MTDEKRKDEAEKKKGEEKELENLPEVAEVPDQGDGHELDYGIAHQIEEEMREAERERKDDSVSTDEIGSEVEMPKTPEEEAAFYKELAQRIAAEFDNYRKRVAEEFEQVRNSAKEDLISRLLVVLDHMELALKAAESSQDPKAILDGVKLILKQLRDVLESEGLKKIKAEGKFDPRYHECVDCETRPDAEPDEIIEVLQDGYEYKGKVLRAAKVRVAIPPKKSGKSGDAEGGNKPSIH